MTDLARKLQLKEAPIRVLNAPADLDLDLPTAGVDGGPESPGEGDAVLVFVRDAAELESAGGPALETARADGLAWIAYPKGGQLGTDLNRDTLWARLEGRGVRPVRQVSIDQVWSALRFRPA